MLIGLNLQSKISILFIKSTKQSCYCIKRREIIIELFGWEMGALEGYWLVCCCSCSLCHGIFKLFLLSLVSGTRRLTILSTSQSFVFQISILVHYYQQKSGSKMMFLACFSLNNTNQEKQATLFCRAFLALQFPVKIHRWRHQEPEKRGIFQQEGTDSKVNFWLIFLTFIGLEIQPPPNCKESLELQLCYWSPAERSSGRPKNGHFSLSKKDFQALNTCF